MDVKKADYLLFKKFWVFVPWFEAFIIQNRKIKLEIHYPRPEISLETKFQPIILKTVDSIFFSRATLFFPILKTRHFWTVIFKNRNFLFQIQNPWVDPVLRTKFHESTWKTAIIREEVSIFLITLYMVLNPGLMGLKGQFLAVIKIQLAPDHNFLK